MDDFVKKAFKEAVDTEAVQASQQFWDNCEMLLVIARKKIGADAFERLSRAVVLSGSEQQLVECLRVFYFGGFADGREA